MRLFETNSFRFAELREWLAEHVKPLPGMRRAGLAAAGAGCRPLQAEQAKQFV